jgi:glycosyltransferase involved in cell wall biosynthesis
MSNSLGMNILHLCGSSVHGGAARASYRIHSSLRGLGISSRFRCLDNTSDDQSLLCGPVEGSERLHALIHRRLLLKAAQVSHGRQATLNYGYTSLAWPGTGLVREACVRRADLIHLHWIGQRLVSIEEIGRLTQPLVWTLHDQWPFCGAEHHVGLHNQRYVQGYRSDNRPLGEQGADLNLRTWQRKHRHWVRPMHLVSPSKWMADCARSSALMANWPIEVIPHPLDLQIWKPLPQRAARRMLGISPEVRILLLVAHDAFGNPVKGADLLMKALPHLQAIGPLELIVVGQRQPAHPPHSPYPIQFLGTLHDTVSMRLAYAAADLLVVPSRQESFCQAATEAQACGRPVAAFATCGLPDVVEDRCTGALARPFAPVDLAAAIDWILADTNRWARLCAQARERAETLWCPQRVASAYKRVYCSALANSNKL